MASTNKTTNYELSQFVETDRPAWLTDYNGDMRTIDSTMKAISDVASGASGSISELADRMSTAEGNIGTNTNDIAALDARADALEAGAQSTAGTIANIQTEQTAQNLRIEAATELGYNLARPYDSASTYAVGAYVLFQNTLYKCVTVIATGEAFDPTKWLAIKATDEIAAGRVQIVPRTNWRFNNISYTPSSGITVSTTPQTVICNAIRINNTQLLALKAFLIVLTKNTSAGGYVTFSLPVDASYRPVNNSVSSISCDVSNGLSGSNYGVIDCRADLGWSNDMLHITLWLNNKEAITSQTDLYISPCFLYEV